MKTPKYPIETSDCVFHKPEPGVCSCSVSAACKALGRIVRGVVPIDTDGIRVYVCKDCMIRLRVSKKMEMEN